MQINRSKPIVTYTLLGICLVMYALEAFLSRSLFDIDTSALIMLGAKYNPLIIAGQWWRLILPMFLHGGAQHILFNGMALFIWGPQAEALLGRFRYQMVFLLSGFAGCCMSFAFSSSISVGASGSIMGIFGALLYFRTRHKEVFNRVFGIQTLILIGINVAQGFFVSNIDNFGHIGGLIGGFLASYTLGLLGENKPSPLRLLAGAGLAALCVALIGIGFVRYG